MVANVSLAGAGLALFAVAGADARRMEVRDIEEDVFRSVNQLPDRLNAPVWGVMQLGSLGGALMVSLTAWAGRRPVTAIGLAATGTAVWGGAKVVKRAVGRGRPAAHLDDVQHRGKPASGLGFPSGHAAVSACVATVAVPALPGPARAALIAAAAATAAARLYVGAHLPLDAAGGIGLGVAAGAVANLTLGSRPDR